MDVRRVEAPVPESMVLLAFDLPPATMGDGEVFATVIRIALSIRLEDQIASMWCGPRFTARSRLLTCVVQPEEGADVTSFATRVREAADVRGLLDVSYLQRALVEAREDFEQISGLGGDLLEPVPGAYPESLALWMYFTIGSRSRGRVPRRSPARPPGRSATAPPRRWIHSRRWCSPCSRPPSRIRRCPGRVRPRIDPCPSPQPVRRWIWSRRRPSTTACSRSPAPISASGSWWGSGRRGCGSVPASPSPQTWSSARTCPPSGGS